MIGYFCIHHLHCFGYYKRCLAGLSSSCYLQLINSKFPITNLRGFFFFKGKLLRAGVYCIAALVRNYA